MKVHFKQATVYCLILFEILILFSSMMLISTKFNIQLVGDVTPPVLHFTSSPRVSADEITIEWLYNEASNSSCTIQTPDQSSIVVDCDLSWTGTNLTEGSYAIYITGTDAAGNVAQPRIHFWTVGELNKHSILKSSPNWQTCLNCRGFICDVISNQFCKSSYLLAPSWFPLRTRRYWKIQQNVPLLFI